MRRQFVLALITGVAGVTAAAVAVADQPCPTGVMRPIAAGPNNTVTNAVVFGNRIAVRGGFTAVNGQPAIGVAFYDDATEGWTNMSAGWLYGTNAAGRNTLAAAGTVLYATSWDVNSPTNFNAIAGLVWNGATWSPAPTTGLPAPDVTLAAVNAGDRLIVEGKFAFPHENPNIFRHRRYAFFDGSTWTPIGAEYGINVQRDSNFPTLNCAARFQGSLYVAGGNGIARGDSFNTNVVASSAIHRWDGERFQPLANGGLNGSVAAMAVFQDKLYVAGTFTATADGSIQLLRIARYTGTAWEPVGGGLGAGGEVQGMVVADDGSGEKLHIATFGNVITAFNQPSPTTDTVSFRGAVRWSGDRYQAYSATPSGGLWSFTGNIVPVRYDNGEGEALYWIGSQHTFGNVAGSTRVTRWGPGPMNDTDRDGLFDVWETEGIDADCDGDIDLNLPAMGANPNHVDVFVEVDSMQGRAPSLATLNTVVAAFAAAPNESIDNPDGADGVNLHLVIDPLDQFFQLEDFVVAWRDFHAFKARNFGNPLDLASPNRAAILDAKKRAFRYCVFGNRYNNSGSSGLAELSGNDFMVTLGAFPSPGGTPQEQAATFMHELGHTLGLFHGGHQSDENRFNFKPNYHSVMNYSWQLAYTRPGWTLDYSRQALPDLDETELDEESGIGGDPGAFALVGNFPSTFSLPESGPIDYNRNGSLSAGVTADINRIRPDYPHSFDVLEGCEDWSLLVYNFRNSPNYASGDSPQSTINVDRMTPELAAAINALHTAPCPADLGATGGAPGSDGILDNNDFVVFIDYFFAHSPAADIGSTGGMPGADNAWDNNDFVVFIDRFFAGCG